MNKIKYITNLILNQSYESSPFFLGNVNASLMKDTKTMLQKGISQYIAVVDALNPHLLKADELGEEDIIFQYFWGIVYEYLNTVPNLKEAYIGSDTEGKIVFFKNLLQNPFDIDLLRKNRDLLFSFTPDRTRFFVKENQFKIGILNYQSINSEYLIRAINSIIRGSNPHIPLFILSENQGLKSIETNGGEWINQMNDFNYYDLNTQSSGVHKLENTNRKGI